MNKPLPFPKIIKRKLPITEFMGQILIVLGTFLAFTSFLLCAIFELSSTAMFIGGGIVLICFCVGLSLTHEAKVFHSGTSHASIRQAEKMFQEFFEKCPEFEHLPDEKTAKDLFSELCKKSPVKRPAFPLNMREGVFGTYSSKQIVIWYVLPEDKAYQRGGGDISAFIPAHVELTTMIGAPKSFKLPALTISLVERLRFVPLREEKTYKFSGSKELWSYLISDDRFTELLINSDIKKLFIWGNIIHTILDRSQKMGYHGQFYKKLLWILRSHDELLNHLLRIFQTFSISGD